jgi:hypothetical protein
MAEQPHVLVYYGNDEWDVEHPGCEVAWYQREKCGVAFEFNNSGLQSFFTDDPDEVFGYATLITIPGRYWIEWWEEKSYHHEYGAEYSSGVQLIYPEEAING